MNVLITGSGGFIGSRLVESLREADIYVLGVDLRKTPTTDVQMDLSDFRCREKLTKLMRDHKITKVVHLAALIRVGEGEDQPLRYWNVNFKGTYNVLFSMEQAQVKRLIFASSVAVYEPAPSYLKETSFLGPISVYGRTKLHAENLIKSWEGIDYVILRLSNVAGGKEENPCHVIPLMIKSCLNGESPLIFGNDYNTSDGTCFRTFVHVDDVLYYIFYILHVKDIQGIYNVGRIFTSVHMIYTKIRSILEKKGISCQEVKFVEKRRGDPNAIMVCDTKLQDEIPYEQLNGIYEMIEDTFNEMVTKTIFFTK